MICQRCQAVEASHQVTERSASGGFIESHFCEGCCKALADLPDPPPAGLFTLVDRQSGQSRVVSFDDLLGMIPTSSNP